MIITRKFPHKLPNANTIQYVENISYTNLLQLKKCIHLVYHT